jgi:hypothetical protein
MPNGTARQLADRAPGFGRWGLAQVACRVPWREWGPSNPSLEEVSFRNRFEVELLSNWADDISGPPVS